jgi:hypothetical protein
MAFGLGSLAPLYGLQQGMMQGEDHVKKQQYNAILQKMAELQLQQRQDEQQSLGPAYRALGQMQDIPGIPQQQPIGQQPQQGAGGDPVLPQVPNATQQMGSPGAVRASWFGNSPGWRDPSDSGLQASGLPVAGNPGIALPTRAGMNQLYDVTAPNGRQLTLPQLDLGPSQDPRKTGGVRREVDINSPAAEAFGYTPQNFPTNEKFIVKAHQQLDQVLDQGGAKLIGQGAPGPLVQDSTRAGMLAGRQIDPREWGRATRQQIVQAIEKVEPNASDTAKMLAFLQLNKIMAPEEKMQAQMWAKENDQAIKMAIANDRATTAEAGLGERTRHDRAMEGIAGARGGSGAPYQPTGRGG